MAKALTNVGASVRARLLTIAKARNQPFDLVLTRYVLERVLYRLTQTWLPSCKRRSRSPKLTARTLAIAILLGAAWNPVHAQTGFVGAISYLMNHHTGMMDTIVIATKGSRSRTTGREGPVIVDTDTHAVFILFRASRTYLQAPFDADTSPHRLMGAVRMSAQDSEWTQSFQVTKTGRVDTVAGVPCDVYRVTWRAPLNGPQAGEDCMAHGIGWVPRPHAQSVFDALLVSQAPMETPAFADLVRNGMGIVKATKTTSRGTFVELIVFAIDRSVPDDSLFSLPAGYQPAATPPR
jgi:hypothetical protein